MALSFFPARMRRLLVGGHNAHMAAAIETLHSEGAVHIEDYRDPTGTTTIGTPLEAGATASELLVAVRGLRKALGAESVKAGVAPSDPGNELRAAEALSSSVIERLHKERSELAAAESEAAAIAPLLGLDIDIGVVGSLSSVKIFVGQARSDPTPLLAMPHELQKSPGAAGWAIALVVAARDGPAAEKALAQSGFSASAIPAGRVGTPKERHAALQAEVARLIVALEATGQEQAKLRAELGPRLAAIEVRLTSDVEKTQAPLKFGVTETTFHIEGWVPASSANRIKNAIAARFKDALYVVDMGDAPAMEASVASAHHARAGGEHGGAGRGVAGLRHDEHATAGVGAHAKADHPTGTSPGSAHEIGGGHDDGHGGHHAVDAKDEPPIHLENKGPAKPYEFLLGLLGKPRYREIDPTKLMLIFFPLFFGLMVGDLAVGLIIVGVGFFLQKNYIFGIGGPAVGRVLVMGGIMAAIVGGVVFGEALGIHFVTPEPHEAGEEKEISWEAILGVHVPSEGFIHKTGGGHELVVDHDPDAGLTDGHATDTNAQTSTDIVPHAEEAKAEGSILSPHTDEHLSVNGWFNLGYYSKIHDIQALLVWSLLIGFVHLVLGFVLGIRNVYVHHGLKLAIQEKVSWLTLIAGVGLLVYGILSHMDAMLWGGVAIAIGSVALLWAGAAHTLGVGFIAILEVPSLAGNLLSYTRLAAIGASKAGMALAFAAIGFDTLGKGDIHSVVGWVVYLLGFVLLIVLSILAGSLQSLRLQFVEFFSKFYQGGGRPYVPFGRRAT